jgi:hypothetical protein
MQVPTNRGARVRWASNYYQRARGKLFNDNLTGSAAGLPLRERSRCTLNVFALNSKRCYRRHLCEREPSHAVSVLGVGPLVAWVHIAACAH